MLNNRIGTFLVKVRENLAFRYGLLISITLLAAGLRFFKLGEWSFWIDEIYTIDHAVAHFSTPELIFENIPPIRNWVPLSVILTPQALNIWGVSEWSARLQRSLASCQFRFYFSRRER
jgi:hypothetical protein